MLKNKFAIVLLVVVMLCCVVFVSGCGNKNLMEDGEYNAVLVAQPKFLSSWPTNLKVEIKNNKLYIENEKMGKLSAGQVSYWPDLTTYEVVEGEDLDTLMTVEDCFIMDSKTDFWGANYFYIISSNNNYYLLCARKFEEGTGIIRFYLLDETSK